MRVKASNFHSQVLDDGAIQWCRVVRPCIRTQRNTCKNYKMSQFLHPQPQYIDVMSQDVTWFLNGFRTCCWRCCCCSVFFHPGKRHSTLWSRLSPLLEIRNPYVMRRNISQNDESRAKRVTPMWLRIKMVFSPYVLNIRIVVFAFLQEIMSSFNVKYARKRPHWWVSTLLCCNLTNAYSLLVRSGALYICNERLDIHYHVYIKVFVGSWV